MSRKLSELEKRVIEDRVPIITDLVVRLGRNYLAAIRAENRGQNEGAHARFENALFELVVFITESGVFDNKH